MAELAPWVQLGMFGLAALAIVSLLRRNWAPGWVIEEKNERIRQLEAEVVKWQDRTFESVRTTRTAVGVAKEVIERGHDVAS